MGFWVIEDTAGIALGACQPQEGLVGQGSVFSLFDPETKAQLRTLPLSHEELFGIMSLESSSQQHP